MDQSGSEMGPSTDGMIMEDNMDLDIWVQDSLLPSCSKQFIIHRNNDVRPPDSRFISRCQLL